MRRCPSRTLRWPRCPSSRGSIGSAMAERLAELELDEEERDVLAAELESVAHGPLSEAGAVSILRWHALSGYSLELTQFTGGRVTIDEGTGALLAAIADAAEFERRLATPVAAVVSRRRATSRCTRAPARRSSRAPRSSPSR